MQPSIASEQPVTSIMRTRLLTARPDQPVREVLELFRGKHVGCVPIVDDDGRPLGIVTKADVIETLDESCQRARDIMVPFALGIEVTATVADAAMIMSFERIHHILVVDDDRNLVGLVSSLDITDWVARQGA
jgi:CBS domain-containing protein